VTHDIFLSYKSEDERLAARLRKALEAEGFSVWWDRSLLPAESWRGQIQSSLDAAAATIVIWTRESTGPGGDFVRDEAGQAKARGRLVPVLMEKTRLPLGFAELQAIDLVGWKGDIRNIFFRDLVATIQAKLDGKSAPKPKGPLRRTLRRSSTAFLSTATMGALFAFFANLMSIQDKVCSLPLAQPKLSDACGQFSLGGKPKRVERLAWASLPADSCNALRGHIEKFPDGVYRSSAADRISARRVSHQEIWEPAQRRLRLAVFSDGLLYATENAAAIAINGQARSEAASLCAGFASTQSYRVLSSSYTIEALDCESFTDGVSCRARGEAICAVEVRGIVESEKCGEPN
jgi:hypothetical protein